MVANARVQVTHSAKLRPEDVLRTSPKKRPDVLRTSSNGPICKAKGRIRSGTSFGRTQDVSLTIIHKICFKGIFSVFPNFKCLSDNVLPNLVKNLIRPILVQLWSGTFRPKQDH